MRSAGSLHVGRAGRTALRSGVLKLCHSCSEPVPDGARFCPSCGVAAAGRGAGASRSVGSSRSCSPTSSGSPSLSEHRDPESVKRLVDRIFEQLVRDVESHGGVVDKVLGDAIVALFGAPVAHEDDADRAVRAALAMQKTLRDFRRSNPADAVRMRIGINTGEVARRHARRQRLHGDGRRREHGVASAGGRPTGSGARRARRRASCAARRSGSRRSTRSSCAAANRRPRSGAPTAVETAAVRRRWPSDVAFVGRAAELGMLRATFSSVARRAERDRLDLGRGRHRQVAPGPGGDHAAAGRAPRHAAAGGGVCAVRRVERVVAGHRWAAGPTRSRPQRPGGDVAAPDHPAARRPVTTSRPGTHEFDRVVELVMHLLGQPSALDALGPTGRARRGGRRHRRCAAPSRRAGAGDRVGRRHPVGGARADRAVRERRATARVACR